MKLKEVLEENVSPYKKINGMFWLEFSTQMMGYDNFTYKGKKVFKYQLFWAGILPSDIFFNRNGFSCEERKFTDEKVE